MTLARRRAPGIYRGECGGVTFTGSTMMSFPNTGQCDHVDGFSLDSRHLRSGREAVVLAVLCSLL